MQHELLDIILNNEIDLEKRIKVAGKINHDVSLKKNDIIVYCNRCGLEITFEVSRDCPRRKPLVS